METSFTSFPVVSVTYRHFFSIKRKVISRPVKIYDMEFYITLGRRTFRNIKDDRFEISVGTRDLCGERKKFFVKTYIEKSEEEYFPSVALAQNRGKGNEVVWKVNREELLKIYDSVKGTSNGFDTLTITLKFGPESEYKIDGDGVRSDWKNLSKAYGKFLRKGEPDIRLQSEGQEFGAHIAFLLARCGMLGKQLSESEENLPTVQLKPAALKRYLAYVYTGIMKGLPLEIRKDVYEFGVKYDLKNLLYIFAVNNLRLDVE